MAMVPFIFNSIIFEREYEDGTSEYVTFSKDDEGDLCIKMVHDNVQTKRHIAPGDIPALIEFLREEFNLD